MLLRSLRLSLVLVALVPFAPLQADQADQVQLPPKPQFHLFLLVGQSNMAGRGKIEPQDQVPHPRVLMLTKEDRWQPAVAPLHFDKPAAAGVGLGRTFGMQIAEANPEITVGLIPCAAGGSPIASWEPGGFHGQTNSHPYDDALRRARLAMQAGTLKGILWHQGESDCRPELAAVYEQKLHALIRRFRDQLAAPELPFLAGQLGQFPERPWDDAKRRVDQAHRDLPGKLPCCAFVRSDNLTHKGDQVHFDSPSLREFGRRYAQAYLELVEGGKR
jgi:hypothetical protein